VVLGPEIAVSEGYFTGLPWNRGGHVV